MTARHLATVMAAAAFAGAPQATHADPVRPRVTVRVYEGAGLSTDVQTAALAVASRTLASASTAVAWKQCHPRPPQPDCDSPSAGDLILRIVRSNAEEQGEHVPLGDALVDIGAGDAVLATVYFDRVVRVARGARMRTATLLGYAVAHELGHLLLASSAHNTEGLMRARWHADELRRARPIDWRFTRQEAAAIQVRLRTDFVKKG